MSTVRPRDADDLAESQTRLRHRRHRIGIERDRVFLRKDLMLNAPATVESAIEGVARKKVLAP